MQRKNKTKIGIIGCGAIGGGVAVYIDKNLKQQASLTALCDIREQAARRLLKKLKQKPAIMDMDELLKKVDLVIEAASVEAARLVLKKAVFFKKDVIILSMGALLGSGPLLEKARKNNINIYLPSGAIAGVDALGALSMGQIKSITLTTSKPPKGLLGAEYFRKKKIDIAGLHEERCVFKGTVKEAIKYFPKNINVAVTLLMASSFSGVKVRINANPFLQRNKHLIEIEAKEAKVRVEVDNMPSPLNPKTSALTILSTQYLLKKLFSPLKIGS
jgi:aspartate dehydrogenase